MKHVKHANLFAKENKKESKTQMIKRGDLD